jgi:hypothetical protein
MTITPAKYRLLSSVRGKSAVATCRVLKSIAKLGKCNLYAP